LPEQKRTRNRLLRGTSIQHQSHTPTQNIATKWPAKATTTRAHRNTLSNRSKHMGKLLRISHTNSVATTSNPNQSHDIPLTPFPQQPSPRPIPAATRLRPSPTSAVWLPAASHGLPTAASTATPTQGEEGPRMSDVLLGSHVLLFLVRGGVRVLC
jgi:hypothetical protein